MAEPVTEDTEGNFSTLLMSYIHEMNKILQGPVTAKHIKVANVAIKDVLVKKLLNRYYDSDGSIGPSLVKINPDVMKTYGVEVTATQDAVTYKIGSSVPPYTCCIEDLSIHQYPKPHSKHQDTPEAHYQPALEAIQYSMEILQIVTQDVY